MKRCGRLLLAVEDEHVRTSLDGQLRRLGHRVGAAAPDLPIERSIEMHQPHLVVVGLPPDDVTRGLATGVRIKRSSAVPFVFVGGWLSASDRFEGFQHGAEDVIRVPCPDDELRARVAVVLRRWAEPRELLEFDDIVLNPAAHEVIRAGGPVALTSIEFSLLDVLMRHRGQVLSKTQLLRDVWGYEHYDVNLVEVHVCALRRKLEVLGPRVIHTVRGVGYVLRTSSAPSLLALA